VTAREAAFRTLTACEQQNAWADGFLKRTLREGALDAREAALATRLTFGVLQNRMLLDWYIDRFTRKKLDFAVRTALRLGVYQMLFLTRVPVSAAVNESVKLTKTYAKNPAASKLVNAVLRSLERQRQELAPPEDLSILYSHPRWLVDAFLQRLGEEETRALLACHNGEPPTAAQVNTCRATTRAVQEALTAARVEAKPHPWLEDCLELRGTGSLEELEPFQGGEFYIQDAAARLAVVAAQPKPGMRVLDACAAPGGKSFAAAIAMGDVGEILSCDIHPHKQALIQRGAQRLGLRSIQAVTQNAKERVQVWEGQFDLVLADVPCSGLGIIRKKPDIRYKDPKPLEGLPAVQGAILDNVSAYVKPGGVLLYSTCTLLERENEDVVRAFIDRHQDFTLETLELPEPVGRVEAGMLTLWPHRHGTDGFFLAKLRKRL
jgi:16S rRNA (cytosine967-C5)-methyltransferase